MILFYMDMIHRFARVRYDWSDLAYTCIGIPLGKWKVLLPSGANLCLDYAVYPRIFMSPGHMCLEASIRNPATPMSMSRF